VAGNFNDTAFFGAYAVFDNGYTNVYLTKLNTSGAFQWAKGGGSASGDGITGLWVNRKDGNCFLTGFVNGNANFGPGMNLTSNGLNDAFILRYNNTGTPMFVLKIGGANYDQGKCISGDEGGGVVYVAGEYTGSVSVGTNPLPVPPASTWFQFLARISTGTVGVDETVPAITPLGLHPNPARDELRLVLDPVLTGPAAVRIDDAAGRMVHAVDVFLVDGAVSVSVSSLAAGTYSATVIHDGRSLRAPFVVTR
jgi:hypothetical protein